MPRTIIRLHRECVPWMHPANIPAGGSHNESDLRRILVEYHVEYHVKQRRAAVCHNARSLQMRMAAPDLDKASVFTKE